MRCSLVRPEDSVSNAYTNTRVYDSIRQVRGFSPRLVKEVFARPRSGIFPSVSSASNGDKCASD